MDLKKLSAVALLLATPLTSHAVVISGSSLQNVLDAESANATTINVDTDQYNPDQIWGTNPNTGGSTAYLFSQWGTNTNGSIWDFGIYDINDHTNTLELNNFASITGSVQFSFLELNNDGQNSIILNNSTDSGVDFASEQFGFYLKKDGSEYTTYSQNFLNTGDELTGANDEMVAFAGEGGYWNPGQFVLAFDFMGGSGGDYDDYVAIIESINPVPEPTSIALIGLGLLGMGAARRRRS